MENNFKVSNIFPIPLYQTLLPNSLSPIRNWLDKQPLRIYPPETKFSQDSGDRSEDSYILNNEECDNLRDFILLHATQYAQEIIGYKEQEYKFLQSWISIKHPNQSHHIHTHGNSLISGVLYYGSYDLNTPSICFHSLLNTPSPYNSLIIDTNPSFATRYNRPTVEYNVSPGLLLLFPSYLPHSVPTNTTNKPRKSLSFNIVPKNGFGSEDALTELKFN